MDKKILSQLEALSLSPNEARVYLALLNVGQTSAGKVIKETQLHRSVVYETFDKLIARKLVFKVTKKKIAYFQISSPDRLTQDAQDQYELAKELVPRLKTMVGKELPEITIHEGIESYRKFWLDTVKKHPVGTVDQVAGTIGILWLTYMGPSAKEYFHIATQRKISWKIIVFDKDDYEETFLADYPEFKWSSRLLARKFAKEGNFNVMGNTLLLQSTSGPIVIEIKNESLVRVFQNLFDILWGFGKKLR